MGSANDADLEKDSTRSTEPTSKSDSHVNKESALMSDS